MGQLRSTAPMEIELAEVRLTELIAVCGIASADKFTAKYREMFGLQMHYCGSYVLFSRFGECSEAVSLALVRSMKGLDDYHNVEGEREELKQAAEAKAIASKVEEAAKKRAAVAEYEAKKLAQIEAKKSNSAFTEVEPVELVTDDALAAQHTAKPVDPGSMMADMAAEKGSILDDGERRSMEAAIARANKGRKK